MTSAKNLALLLAVALAGCGVGGVIVWLMSK
jgi:hypothetical protein